MVSFTASAIQGGAQIEWSTATEINSAVFEVERRALNGGSWSTIATLQAAGTSFAPKYYSYLDEGVGTGSFAYRLKQIDKDGTYSYFGAAEVVIGVAKEFRIAGNYPNPFNPSTKISFSVASDDHATMKVYNMMGQEVATLFNGPAVAGSMYTVNFDAANLTSGVYFSRLESHGVSAVRRMLLVK